MKEVFVICIIYRPKGDIMPPARGYFPVNPGEVSFLPSQGTPYDTYSEALQSLDTVALKLPDYWDFCFQIEKIFVP